MSHYNHLTTKEGCCIVHFKKLGWAVKDIANELGRDRSTIYRELKRNTIDNKYSATKAGELYRNRRSNCGAKGKKQTNNLVEYINAKLQLGWSPEQIEGRLTHDYPLDNQMRISFKTIYNWIYDRFLIKGDLTRLRRKGKSRKPKETRGKFNTGKSIKERPKEVRKREIAGHWELDTVVSSRGKSKACLATFVERKTRFLYAVLMPNRKAVTLNNALFSALSNLPKTIIKSLTVDRGKEFAKYEDIEKYLETDVYFADPYSSWQRGTNENTNGLLREYFPKKFNFNTTDQDEVNHVLNLLNHRPRKCLGYKTPYEAFINELNKCCT
jgi:IS30 family transposase